MRWRRDRPTEDLSERIAEELNHIGRGGQEQELFRLYYHDLRLNALSLELHSDPAVVLTEAVSQTRQFCPEFDPDYDADFFESRPGRTPPDSAPARPEPETNTNGSRGVSPPPDEPSPQRPTHLQDVRHGIEAAEGRIVDATADLARSIRQHGVPTASTAVASLSVAAKDVEDRAKLSPKPPPTRPLLAEVISSTPATFRVQLKSDDERSWRVVITRGPKGMWRATVDREVFTFRTFDSPDAALEAAADHVRSHLS